MSVIVRYLQSIIRPMQPSVARSRGYKMSIRTERQLRTVATNFKTREDGEELRIEGYFAVFNSIYNIFDGAEEVIAPGAFANTIGDDVRALIDHETMYVLGRTTADTLELREDDIGLWGTILINPNDQDAMNVYARIARGDVSQCSIGFEIVREEAEFLDGVTRWTIEEVKLYEVSVCTFPAYSETSVKARKDDLEEIKARKMDAWRAEMIRKLKGGE